MHQRGPTAELAIVPLPHFRCVLSEVDGLLFCEDNRLVQSRILALAVFNDRQNFPGANCGATIPGFVDFSTRRLPCG